MRRSVTTASCVAGAMLVGLWCGSVSSGLEESTSTAERLAALDVPGGLVVQLGASDCELATELARTGRFIVQVLDADRMRVQQVRQRLQQEGLYGWISADRRANGTALPYTENLVNLVVVQTLADEKTLSEMARVLRPQVWCWARRSSFPPRISRELTCV